MRVGDLPVDAHCVDLMLWCVVMMLHNLFWVLLFALGRPEWSSEVENAPFLVTIRNVSDPGRGLQEEQGLLGQSTNLTTNGGVAKGKTRPSRAACL